MAFETAGKPARPHLGGGRGGTGDMAALNTRYRLPNRSHW